MPSSNSDRSDDSDREEGHVDFQDAGDESDVSYSKDSEGNADVDDSDDGSGSNCLKDSGRHVNADDVEDGSDDSHDNSDEMDAVEPRGQAAVMLSLVFIT